MKIDKFIKSIFAKFGFDIRMYDVSRSNVARLNAMIRYNKINCVFDVGANVGNYARYLRSIGYCGRIVCFEPLSSAYMQLEKMSKGDRLITVAPRMAVGDYDGCVTINVSGNSESSSILPMCQTHLAAAPYSSYVGSEEVIISRLDNICYDYASKEDNIFLKIDVQGYEKNVLDGAIDIMDMVKVLQIEVSLCELYQGEMLYYDMIRYVESLGYELYDLNTNFANRETGKSYQMDAMFSRKNQ